MTFQTVPDEQNYLLVFFGGFPADSQTLLSRPYKNTTRTYHLPPTTYYLPPNTYYLLHTIFCFFWTRDKWPYPKRGERMHVAQSSKPSCSQSRQEGKGTHKGCHAASGVHLNQVANGDALGNARHSICTHQVFGKKPKRGNQTRKHTE